MTHNRTIDVSGATRRISIVSDYFADTYKSLKAEWSPDVPPVTLVFASLGRAFCENANSVSHAELLDIMSAIEELITMGDTTVKNAVTTGFLEAILSESSSGRFNVNSVSQCFGPATMAYCKAWDEFTGCDTLGLL